MTSPHLTKLDAVVEMAGKATADETRELLSKHLRDVYCCTRVWEAWQVGTMGEDDFQPAWEDDELLDGMVKDFAPASARQLVPALAGMVKAAWLAIEGAPHSKECESHQETGPYLCDRCDYRARKPCTCWKSTALATLTQEIERLKV